MNLGIQAIQHPYLKSIFDKTVNQVAANESRTAEDKNAHDRKSPLEN